MAAAGVSWTEKYRPQRLDQVQGNPSAIRKLQAWADEWAQGRPDKPGAILVGEAGIGKTSAAHALANEMGWTVIELNASDARTKGIIEQVVTRGATTRGFSPTGAFDPDERKNRKLIILDEADNVFGREDRGGMKQIVETLKETQQPIVLTANDAYALSRRSSSLKRLCVEIKFQRAQATTVAKVLGNICKEEGVQCELDALEALAEHSGGDLRAAVGDLEALARSTGRVSLEDVDALGYRDTRSTVFDALGTILSSMDLETARSVARELDEDPESLLLWIEENAPREYEDPQDRARAMDVLARADQFLGATRRTQYYRFWSVASDLMTGGVALAKEKPYRGWTRYQFPGWLRKMSRSKANRALRGELSDKVGQAYHAGSATAREHIFPMLGFVAQRSDTFAAHIAAELELEPDELALLLETKASSKHVKELIEQAEEIREARAVETARPGGPLADVARAEAEKPTEDGADAEATEAEDDEDGDASGDGDDQPRLFDF